MDCICTPCQIVQLCEYIFTLLNFMLERKGKDKGHEGKGPNVALFKVLFLTNCGQGHVKKDHKKRI